MQTTWHDWRFTTRQSCMLCQTAPHPPIAVHLSIPAERLSRTTTARLHTHIQAGCSLPPTATAGSSTPPKYLSNAGTSLQYWPNERLVNRTCSKCYLCYLLIHSKQHATDVSCHNVDPSCHTMTDYSDALIHIQVRSTACSFSIALLELPSNEGASKNH